MHSSRSKAIVDETLSRRTDSLLSSSDIQLPARRRGKDLGNCLSSRESTASSDRPMIVHEKSNDSSANEQTADTSRYEAPTRRDGRFESIRSADQRRWPTLIDTRRQSEKMANSSRYEAPSSPEGEFQRDEPAFDQKCSFNLILVQLSSSSP